MSFLDFAETVHFPLSDAQRAFAAVALDNLAISEIPGELRDVAHELFGDNVDHIPHGALSTIGIVAGRGGGKSRLAGAYLIWRALTADLSMLGAGESAYAITVAPDKDLASISLAFAKGLIESSRFASAIEAETADSIVLRRPDGKRVSVEVFTASAGGKSVRGKTIIGAVLDEAAFFGTAGAAVNAEEIFRAIVPRLTAGGKVIIPSTPWLRSGLLWSLFDSNFGAPKTALIASAPTIVFRGDDPEVAAMVAREYERDPDNAARELGAQWLAAGSGNLFDSAALEAAITESTERRKHGRISIGGDVGLVQDPSAFVVTQRPHGSDQINVLDVVELRPKRGQPIELETIVRIASDLCGQYGTRRVRVDHHSLPQMREWASKLKARVVFEAASESGDRRDLRFQRAADMVKRNRLQIPKAFAELADQLGSLVATPKPKGGFSFTAPRRAGSHADSAMALILSVEPLLADSAYGEALRKVGENQLRAAVRLGGFGVGLGAGVMSEEKYETIREKVAATSFCKCGYRGAAMCRCPVEERHVTTA